MAESSNSSTSATSTTGAGSTSTSTNGNGGNGNGGNGNGNGGNGNGKGSSGNNGNFSGGLPGLGGQSWSSYSNSKGSETGAAHSAGVQGPGLQNGNFGSKWGGDGKYSINPNSEGKHVLSPNAEGKYTLTLDGGDGKGNYSTNNTQYMTVDEVYGKGNQSIVESQGDYEATSNEKSNVETSTFGKQDEISVTPTSVTEDKGLVNNDAIQSVEGLDFQQKDKANQDVMEAKKSRDEAEAEDNANGMRDQLKAVAEKDAEDNNAFQVGEKDTFEEQNNVKLNELNQQKQEVDAAKKDEQDAIAVKDKAEAEEEAAIAAADKAKEERDQVKQVTDEIADYLDKTIVKGETLKERFSLDNLKKAIKLTNDLLFDDEGELDGKGKLENYRDQVAALAKEKGIDIEDISKDINGRQTLAALKTIDSTMEARVQEAQNAKQKAQEVANDARNQVTEVTAKVQELQTKYDKANQEYNNWKTDYWAGVEKTKAEEEAAEEAVTTEAPSYEVTIEAARDEINNSKDLTPEQKAETNSVLTNVITAADRMNEASNNLAANLNDINAIQQYKEETARYNKTLRDAKGNKTLKNTDFNKTFTRAVAAANDFDVTMPDGSKKSYAEFAAEMATKSPELAKGLYEAKAENYADKAKKLEDNGEKGIRSAAYKALAAIENAKSKMVMTWLGSKFTFADNQVRSQFNQMAKTDMRATYATYNNVLNDETGKYSEAEKAEASAAINQANSLMTASAALQASTGFLSGIGDGTSDGVYGVTNPDDLNGYQKALNAASNFAKITLGLGVTPGANEAYQNMYYLAGAKVNKSGLFTDDFDGDGFALCQEYGNNAVVGMITGAGELAIGVALMFNPATSKLGFNLAIDSVQTFLDGLYGVQKEVNKSIKYSSEVLNYFNEAKSIAAETGNKEATSTMDSAIKQIEDFQLKSDEVGNLDNWLEGSGSNTADNGKFNQALTYDEWLKLIEADPVMQEYAKSLNR